MDRPEESFAGHNMGELPENLYNKEQPNPYSDVAEQYNEQPGNPYSEEPGDQYHEGSRNSYNEVQANLFSDEPGNQYNEEQANTYQEETVNPYHDEMKQQDNSQVEANNDKGWPGWPGDSVFCILVPAQKVGAIIGHKGEFIKRMCEESKARIKILDGPPGVLERAVIIFVKSDLMTS